MKAPVLSLEPAFGFWYWGGAPKELGLFTALRLGVGYADQTKVVLLQYRWETLHDAASEEDSRIRALWLTYGFEF